MKKLTGILLLLVSLFSALPSYAVTCSATGPRGGTWTSSGVTRNAAINNAIGLCTSRSGGPCTFIVGSCRWP